MVLASAITNRAAFPASLADRWAWPRELRAMA
jgi:hypothetical protein